MNRCARSFLISMIAVLSCFSLCIAENRFLLQPNIDYSADEIMRAGDMTVRSKVFYAPGKIRKDRTVGSTVQITIIRQDKDVIWMLMPGEKTYTEMPIKPGKTLKEDLSGDFMKNTGVQSVLGEEIVNGVKAAKRQVTIKDPGGVYEGVLWQSRNGIIVKMEVDPKKSRSRLEPVTLELNNIRQEPQNPALFEIPRGYTKTN